MKTTIIAFSAVAFIAVAPVALAQGVSARTSGLQHENARKHNPGVAGYAPLHKMQATSKKGYPGAFGYAPEVLDRETQISRQAGGGGGGGGGM